ncbi:MAG: dihydroorotate dehydrogenase-like protein [Acidobacteria bacterium]|nr:dihydroorotate dehydrogenase-like protein [Acidobacteriota bacterium]
MDLSTTYLGLALAHPFMAGASPLSDQLDVVRRLEDGGAAAVVLRSLFEEQITFHTGGKIRQRDPNEAEFAAALAHFPDADAYSLTPDGYLEHLRRVKAAVSIPVMASLNGTTSEAWIRFAARLPEAGADAVEINMYDVISDPRRSALAVETELRDLVLELKRAVRIPIAMKLSPYYTAVGHLAHRLDEACVDGLVLFNRFYQPDIDLTTMTIGPRLELSSSAELPLRLQWIALLHGRVRASLALSGGVSQPADGIKAVLAGADAVQMVSAVLRDGPSKFAAMRDGLRAFMNERGFTSVAQMKGHVSFANAEDPMAFQRAHYIRTLQSWKLAPDAA